MEKVNEAVGVLVELAEGCSGGSEAALAVLLSCWDSGAFPLDLRHIKRFDQRRRNAAVLVINHFISGNELGGTEGVADHYQHSIARFAKEAMVAS